MGVGVVLVGVALVDVVHVSRLIGMMAMGVTLVYIVGMMLVGMMLVGVALVGGVDVSRLVGMMLVGVAFVDIVLEHWLPPTLLSPQRN